MEDNNNIENNNASAAGQEQQAQTNNIDYSKIENMINRGVQQKESAILKSYFQQQGMSEEEIKSAVSDWKAKKATAAQEKETSFTKLQEQSNALQKALNTEKLNNAAFMHALDLGIEKNVIPYVLKSAELSDAFDDKGEIKADTVKAALEKVLQDVPAFKAKANENKGFKVGVGAEQQTQDNQMKALRSAFGLK